MELDNGATVKVEATPVSELEEETEVETGDVIAEDVSSSFPYLQEATEAIQGRVTEEG